MDLSRVFKNIYHAEAELGGAHHIKKERFQ